MTAAPDPVGQFDDGLQRERTALAWNRTALALLVVGSLMTRFVGPPYFDVAHAPGYAALIAGGVVLWLSANDERWRTKAKTRAQMHPARVWSIGIITLLLNLASLVIVATGR